MILHSALAFLAGALYELACVFWVHFSQLKRSGIAAFFSMLSALTEVVGIGESIHDWHLAPGFILGFGVGTFVAVRLNGKFPCFIR
jgi:hypothetical protein